MASCIMSKCRGGGFLCEGTFLHSQERRSVVGVGVRVGLGERIRWVGVGGHYGFMHNVEMSGWWVSLRTDVPTFPRT